MANRRKDEFEDRLKRHPGVLRIYQQYVDLKKGGRQYIGLCPFHNDHNPSFNVFADDSEPDVLVFKCNGCNVVGNIGQFVQRIEDCSFPEAVEKIREMLDDSWEAKREHVDRVFKPTSKVEEKPKKTFEVQQFLKWEAALELSQPARDWLLNERGITYEVAQRFHIGFKKDISEYCGTETKKELADVIDKGWLAFPYIQNGKVVAVKFRSIVRKAFAQIAGMKVTLFNLNTIDFLDPVFVTEGELDALVMEQAGFRAVALPNATFKLTPELKDRLMEASKTYLAGDNDGAVGSDVMNKLFAEMRNRTFKLVWPQGMKDANQTFVEYCKRDINRFREVVKAMIVASRVEPMPHFKSAQEYMATATEVNLQDDPNRFRFKWKDVDQMAILVPGSVLCLFATNTGMGKTVWTMDATLHAAIHHNEVVINYQCELTEKEFFNAMAANLADKDRRLLTPTDSKEAARLMGNAKYYYGRDQSLDRVQPVLDLIESAIQRLGATVVVLDHIHFICRNEDNEVQALANAMQRIKRIAGQYGVKFIVLGQPRKAAAKDKGKQVHVSDAKGSETFSSDADAVFTLHRNQVKNIDPANPPEDEYEAKTEIRCVKLRTKGMGKVVAYLLFKGALAKFGEMTFEEPPSGVPASK